MALPILVIKGFDIAGVSWYADQVKESELYKKAGVNVEVMDYDYGENESARNTIVEAIRSRRYKSIIIADLSDDDHFAAFKRYFGAALVEYVNQGGSVAFPTCEGLLLVDVLKALFGVQWEAATYRRTNYRAPDGRAEEVVKMFPLNRIHSGKKKASEVEFSVKACSYKNVPADEQFFGNTGEGHSKIPALNFIHAAEPGEPEGMWMYSVAVHKHGEGKIAFFGDVNGEPVTCDLVAAFCLA